MADGSPPVCARCNRNPPQFDACWATVDYAFPWAGLVASFKFREGLDLCSTLAAMMNQHPAPSDGLPRLVLPVPLSRRRLRQRGYNQAWELARRVAAHRGWNARHDLLIKTRDTAEQMSLPASERASNLHSAFALAEGAPDALRHQHVVVVDDVMTTGATMNALATVLKQGGAASVVAWVFARTPNAVTG